jgi:hypothetical protein
MAMPILVGAGAKDFFVFFIAPRRLPQFVRRIEGFSSSYEYFFHSMC